MARINTPQSFLQGLVGKPIRIYFSRVESAAVEGLLAGFDSYGVVLRRADRETLFPWMVLRSIEAAETN